MKKMLFLIAVFLLPLTAFAEESQKTKEFLEGTFSTTIATQYKSVGRSKFGNKGLFSPGINLDIGKGFSLDTRSYLPISSGYEDSKKNAYTLFYETKLFREEKYEINVKSKQLFYDIINGNKHNNYQETGCKLAFPKLINFENSDQIIPSYYGIAFWSQKKNNSGYNGFAHIFNIDYVKKINTKQKVKYYSNITYNDSIGDSGSFFSHITIGTSTDIKLKGNLVITPFINYQISLENSVCDKNDVYGGLIVRYKF